MWSLIAEKLKEAGYILGNEREAAEKCRQKFANLMKSYTNFISKAKHTDEARAPKPAFYEELHEIIRRKT